MRTLVVGRRRWLLQTGSGVGADPEDHSCSSVLSARGSESARLILYDYKSFPLPLDPKGIIPGPPWLTPIRSWLVAYWSRQEKPHQSCLSPS